MADAALAAAGPVYVAANGEQFDVRDSATDEVYSSEPTLRAALDQALTLTDATTKATVLRGTDGKADGQWRWLPAAVEEAAANEVDGVRLTRANLAAFAAQLNARAQAMPIDSDGGPPGMMPSATHGLAEASATPANGFAHAAVLAVDDAGKAGLYFRAELLPEIAAEVDRGRLAFGSVHFAHSEPTADGTIEDAQLLTHALTNRPVDKQILPASAVRTQPQSRLPKRSERRVSMATRETARGPAIDIMQQLASLLGIDLEDDLEAEGYASPISDAICRLRNAAQTEAVIAQAQGTPALPEDEPEPMVGGMAVEQAYSEAQLAETWRFVEHVGTGGEPWCVLNHDRTQKLGCYPSKEAAETRLKQIEAAKYGKRAAEALRASNKDFWVTRDEMRVLCPSCATRMEARRMTRINLRAMPPQLVEGLCGKLGGDPGLFTTCTGMSFGSFDPGDKNAFCAWLHHECTGQWPAQDHAHSERTDNMTTPNASGGGASSAPTMPTGAEAEAALSEFLTLGRTILNKPDASAADVLSELKARTDQLAAAAASKPQAANAGPSGSPAPMDATMSERARAQAQAESIALRASNESMRAELEGLRAADKRRGHQDWLRGEIAKRKLNIVEHARDEKGAVQLDAKGEPVLSERFGRLLKIACEHGRELVAESLDLANRPPQQSGRALLAGQQNTFRSPDVAAGDNDTPESYGAAVDQCMDEARKSFGDKQPSKHILRDRAQKLAAKKWPHLNQQPGADDGASKSAV